MVSRSKKKRREIKRRNSARAREGYYPYDPGTVLDVEFWPASASESLGVGTRPQEGKEIGHPDSGVSIKLTVVKTFSRTLSCVLLGRVDLGKLDDKSRVAFTANHVCEDHGSRKDIKVVLKLYDRRFSDGIREDYGGGEWTPKVEADWRRFEALDEQDKPEVCVVGDNDSWLYRSSDEEGEGRKEGVDYDREFKLEVVDQEKERPRSDRKKGRRNIEEGNLTKKATSVVNGRQPSQAASSQKKVSPSKWTAGHREAYMQKVCNRGFSTELSIYQHLKPVQGKSVPFVYGTVRIPIGDGDCGRTGNQVNGLMMEHIHPSFTLRGIPGNVSERGTWQELGEMAVGLVRNVGDGGFLNEDVRLDNILVVPVQEGYYEHEDRGDEEDSDNGSEDSKKLRFFKAVMIDFGLARVRREDEGDEEWNKARYFRDEEGAVGYVLENFLKTAAGSEWEARPFKFRHSHRLELQHYDDAQI